MGLGPLVYMPPEIFGEITVAIYTIPALTSLLELLLAIFAIGEVFPCNPLKHTYYDEIGMLLGRTELQRRSNFMRCMNKKLSVCGQLSGDHPLIRLIHQYLQARGQLFRLLEEPRAGVGQEEIEKKKCDLVQAFLTQPRKQEVRQIS